MEFSEDWRENEKIMNELPEFEKDIDYPEENIPQFANRTIEDATIDNESKYEFVRRFLLYYLTFEEFKNIVDGWVFLFVMGRYIGTYKNENEAFDLGRKITKNGVMFMLFQ